MGGAKSRTRLETSTGCCFMQDGVVLPYSNLNYSTCFGVLCRVKPRVGDDSLKGPSVAVFTEHDAIVV